MTMTGILLQQRDKSGNIQFAQTVKDVPTALDLTCDLLDAGDTYKVVAKAITGLSSTDDVPAWKAKNKFNIDFHDNFVENHEEEILSWTKPKLHNTLQHTATPWVSDPSLSAVVSELLDAQLDADTFLDHLGALGYAVVLAEAALETV